MVSEEPVVKSSFTSATELCYRLCQQAHVGKVLSGSFLPTTPKAPVPCTNFLSVTLCLSSLVSIEKWVIFCLCWPWHLPPPQDWCSEQGPDRLWEAEPGEGWGVQGAADLVLGRRGADPPDPVWSLPGAGEGAPPAL